MKTFYKNISAVPDNTRQTAYRAVNFAMVEAHWQIGQLIVKEQQGNNRAEYGSGLLKYLAHHLTSDFGKGFDESHLRCIHLFYKAFPIRDALRHELNWTHYHLLLKVDNPDARAWYIVNILLLAQNHRTE